MKYTEFKNKIFTEINLQCIKNVKDVDIFIMQETALHIIRYVIIAMNEIIFLICAEIDIGNHEFIQYKLKNKEMELK